MNTQQRAQWNNRPTYVRVLTLCDSCSTLKEGVETREETSYWPSFHVKLHSCQSCFEAAKAKARSEAGMFTVTITLV